MRILAAIAGFIGWTALLAGLACLSLLAAVIAASPFGKPMRCDRWPYSEQGCWDPSLYPNEGLQLTVIVIVGAATFGMLTFLAIKRAVRTIAPPQGPAPPPRPPSAARRA
jgi:hypothetical protein